MNDNIKKAINKIENNLDSRSLDLSNLNLTTEDLAYIFSLKEYKDFFNFIRVLFLKNNKLKNVPTVIFKVFECLCRLDLRNNEISEIRKGDFDGLKAELYYLDLDDNPINVIQKGAFNGLPQCLESEGVLYLYLKNNKIKNIQAGIFEGIPKLIYVDIRSDYTQTIEKGVFSELKRLQEIDLTYKQVQQIQIDDFKELKCFKQITIPFKDDL